MQNANAAGLLQRDHAPLTPTQVSEAEAAAIRAMGLAQINSGTKPPARNLSFEENRAQATQESERMEILREQVGLISSELLLSFLTCRQIYHLRQALLCSERLLDQAEKAHQMGESTAPNQAIISPAAAADSINTSVPSISHTTPQSVRSDVQDRQQPPPEEQQRNLSVSPPASPETFEGLDDESLSLVRQTLAAVSTVGSYEFP